MESQLLDPRNICLTVGGILHFTGVGCSIVARAPLKQVVYVQDGKTEQD